MDAATSLSVIHMPSVVIYIHVFMLVKALFFIGYVWAAVCLYLNRVQLH